MGYSAEVVQRARARLAQAKEDRESENRQHLAQAYAKVPRIREIDMLLRRTMAQAAQAAFLQGSDGQALLDYVTGVRTEISGKSCADLDKDGDRRGGKTSAYSRNGQRWPRRTLRMASWTKAPFVTNAAAAAMWALPCASA